MLLYFLVYLSIETLRLYIEETRKTFPLFLSPLGKSTEPILTKNIFDGNNTLNALQALMFGREILQKPALKYQDLVSDGFVPLLNLINIAFPPLSFEIELIPKKEPISRAISNFKYFQKLTDNVFKKNSMKLPNISIGSFLIGEPQAIENFILRMCRLQTLRQSPTYNPHLSKKYQEKRRVYIPHSTTTKVQVYTKEELGSKILSLKQHEIEKINQNKKVILSLEKVIHHLIKNKALYNLKSLPLLKNNEKFALREYHVLKKVGSFKRKIMILKGNINKI